MVTAKLKILEIPFWLVSVGLSLPTDTVSDEPHLKMCVSTPHPQILVCHNSTGLCLRSERTSGGLTESSVLKPSRVIRWCFPLWQPTTHVHAWKYDKISFMLSLMGKEWKNRTGKGEQTSKVAQVFQWRGQGASCLYWVTQLVDIYCFLTHWHVLFQILCMH